ncbi:putative small intestine urate exporter [Dirofilaria immitis]
MESLFRIVIYGLLIRKGFSPVETYCTALVNGSSIGTILEMQVTGSYKTYLSSCFQKSSAIDDAQITKYEDGYDIRLLISSECSLNHKVQFRDVIFVLSNFVLRLYHISINISQVVVIILSGCVMRKKDNNYTLVKHANIPDIGNASQRRTRKPIEGWSGHDDYTLRNVATLTHSESVTK